MITDPVKWLAENFELDPTARRSGKFDPEYCGWLCAPGGPIEAYADPAVTEGCCMTSAQAGKTVTSVGMYLWAQDNQPGPGMWVLPAGDEVQTFAEQRFMPMVNTCGGLPGMLPSARYATKTREINFPFGPLVMVGANSGSKLSGKPIRYLHLDEEKDYPAGAVNKASKRVTSFVGSKIWRTSTPKHHSKSIHEGYLSGCQAEWHVRCPVCGDESEVTWQRMTWQKDEPGTERRYQSIRLRCARDNCDHTWSDNASDRAYLAKHGRWVKANPDAPRWIYSARWNRLIAPWAPWAPVLQEYEAAVVALDRGLQEPMAVWFQEALGLPYEQGQLDEEDPIPEGAYQMADPWPDLGTPGQPGAGFAFLAADVQKDRLEVTARSVLPTGTASRLMHEGTEATFTDLEALRIRLGVAPRWVFIDCRYNTGEVLRACHKYGWTALVGEDRDSGYAHSTGKGAVRRPFSEPQKVDIGVGGQRHGLNIVQFRWSNRLIKDTLALLSAGKTQADWTVARDASKDYRAQLRSEILRDVYDRDTGQARQKWVKRHRDRDNHKWDCECMIVVAMMIARLLPADITTLGEIDEAEGTGLPPRG
jgi:hypothetical protein